MMPAVKHFDPVVGVDIHFIITPPGVVVPIPHPHIGIVFDVFEYIPIIGATVFVNGLRRAQAGTGGRTLPPHFPIGGVFAKPPGNENEAFMGSSTVIVEDEPFTYMLLPFLSCQDIGMPSPPRKKGPGAKTLQLPTSIALSIPMGDPVIVGGPPTISVAGMIMRLAFGALKKLRKLQKGSRRMRAVSMRLHRKASKFMKKLGLGPRARDLIHKGICTMTGHPVDVVTGRVVTEATDWELPGPIPLRFTRHYSSSLGWRDTAMGLGWSHSLDLAVWEEDGRVVYRAEDGRELEFSTEDFPQRRMPVGAEVYEPISRLTLRREGALRWEVESAEGLTHELRGPPGEQKAGVCRVVSTRNRVGHRVEYEYDGQARLRWVRDSAGRRVLFECDAAGRLVRVALPHPREPGQLTHNRYVYSETGNLVEAQDALGHAARYAYAGALLVRETDRTGLSFHFEYDGKGPEAWCVRTWGDGGIFHHTLRYEREALRTEVTDSLGHTTVYESDGRGVVVREVDPLGGEKLKEYDEALRRVSETDELGHTTRYEYDARGNRTKVVGPDGATVEAVYDAFNHPIELKDANSGVWTWRYDSWGLLREEADPLGTTRRYEYAAGLLALIEEPMGARTALRYDFQKNIAVVQLPTGAEVHISYDKLGRPVYHRDAHGGEWRVQYDGLGRLIRGDGPIGTWKKRYDAESNLLEEESPSRHVHFGYAGFHNLAFQQEANHRVTLHHDTEGQLTAVTNEANETSRFTRDALGRVIREEGFDGAVREYCHDMAGRLSKITHPSGRVEIMTRDACGRITEIKYSGTAFRRFRYSLDGALIEAENETGTVLFERDLLGRIVNEQQGGYSVSSKYTPEDERCLMETSLGGRQSILSGSKAREQVLRLGRDSAHQPSIQVLLDGTGLETDRVIPGGVHIQWQRDLAGRPVSRRTLQRMDTASQATHDLGYQWRGEDQLVSLADSTRGTTFYHHDERGRLVEAGGRGGTIHRAMDSVGNVYRTPQRTDRRYGSGGRLEEASGALYEHDKDGNLVSKRLPNGESWTYRWGDAGTLKEIERPDGLRVRFEYDALCRRIRKTLLAVSESHLENTRSETRFVWDGDVVVHEVFNGDRLKTWYWEPETFTPMAMEKEGRHWSIVSDHLGTPTEMYDEQGLLVWRTRLDIFGTATTEGSPEDCPWRWPGQYEDEETGLYYNHFRHYDPWAGGYLEQDPIGVIGGLGLYSYTPDPLIWIDPLGLIFGLYEFAERGGTYIGSSIETFRRLGEHVRDGRIPNRSAAIETKVNVFGAKGRDARRLLRLAEQEALDDARSKGKKLTNRIRAVGPQRKFYEALRNWYKGGRKGKKPCR